MFAIYNWNTFHLFPLKLKMKLEISRTKMLQYILVLSVSVASANSFRSSFEEDLFLTKSEVQALQKFKSRMVPFLPHAYMKQDIYLVKWLRAKNFDVNQASQFLKENLKWRKANGMDRIHEEDFSDIIPYSPVSLDTYAKDGAPVITANTGHWDLRRLHLTGLAQRSQRYLDKIMDEACVKVRAAQLQGKNVTRFHFLLDLDGFNIVQHGCPRCLFGIVTFIQSLDTHFPDMADKIIMFNSPETLQIVAPLVHRTLSGSVASRIKVFGRNKAVWQKMLLEFIDKEQLTEEFGGTRRT